jgi:MFS family permease
MAMPQVHIVSYCTDLGYGAARGAEMLSLMLACGVVSRLVSGAICDRIGGLRTLMLGSVLQGIALLLFLPFDGLVSLYVIAALFGLFQGGLVPAYAIIVREYFEPAEAGARVGTVLMATLLGMALGGWMSGKVFDLTGSYHAAFLNGMAWNLLNFSIAFFLLCMPRQQFHQGLLLRVGHQAAERVLEGGHQPAGLGPVGRDGEFERTEVDAFAGMRRHFDRASGPCVRAPAGPHRKWAIRRSPHRRGA